MLFLYVLEIIGALCLCDLIAFFIYSIKNIPTGFTEGVCYPFFIPCKMFLALIIRLLQLLLIIVVVAYYRDLITAWKIWLPIGTGLFTILYTIIFCNISYY